MCNFLNIKNSLEQSVIGDSDSTVILETQHSQLLPPEAWNSLLTDLKTTMLKNPTVYTSLY